MYDGGWGWRRKAGEEGMGEEDGAGSDDEE